MFESAVNNVKNILSDMTLNDWNSRPECSQVLTRLEDECRINSLVICDKYFNEIKNHLQENYTFFMKYILYNIPKPCYMSYEEIQCMGSGSFGTVMLVRDKLELHKFFIKKIMFKGLQKNIIFP